MKKLKVLRVCLFFILGVFCGVTNLYAQRLSVAPSKVRMIIAPGSTQSGSIQLENNSGHPVQVKAYLEDWEYDLTQSGTKIFRPAGTLPLSCVSWISFAPAELTVPAFGRQSVGFSVKVPENASGGHYAVLFFETGLGEQPRPGYEQESGVTVQVMGRIGSLFYIEPQGTIKREVEFSALEAQRSSNAAPLKVALALENIGNVDITTAATFHIMDDEGVIYARSEFNPTYTFGGAKAKLVGTWKDPIPKGKYDLVLTIDIGEALEEAGLGRGPIIVKEAEIEFGDSGQVVRVGELK
jgi:hypothetical protein